MKLKIDTERITLDDVIALEENKSTKTMRDILARFVQNEDGNYYEFEEAKKILGKLTMREIKGVAEQFADAMRGVQKDSLPPIGSGE